MVFHCFNGNQQSWSWSDCLPIPPPGLAWVTLYSTRVTRVTLAPLSPHSHSHSHHSSPSSHCLRCSHHFFVFSELFKPSLLSSCCCCCCLLLFVVCERSFRSYYYCLHVPMFTIFSIVVFVLHYQHVTYNNNHLIANNQVNQQCCHCMQYL